jgi:hypothetical protein
MEFTYFKKAAYIFIEDISLIDKTPIELGDKILEPGTFISILGKGKYRFELEKGFYLRYVGKIIEGITTTLLFGVNDTKEEGWNYCFGYINRNVLLNLCPGAWYDIKIKEIDIVENPKFEIIPEQLDMFDVRSE